MKKILVIGAGLSASYLIHYLINNALEFDWFITVADANLKLAQEKIKGHPSANAIQLDAGNAEDRSKVIQEHDIVVSLLPPSLHILAAKDCIRFQRHLVTASYVSPEMGLLHDEALAAGVLLLNECGLDPGIDHLSAMKMIHEIQSKGGNITSFKSYCGGLVAPEFDDNPWNYKFTWNPRNVVLAGQATAQYLREGQLKFIPPAHIFEQTEPVQISDYGSFESYANRDSLSYIIPYGIETAHTVLRGTLRREGYSASWNLLVRMGLTDDSFVIHHSDKLTLRQWVNAFTPGSDLTQLEERVCSFLSINQQSEAFKKLKWLGIFENQSIPLKEATPAQILQWVLQQKWSLQLGELDMIVMKHIIQFELEHNGKLITEELSSELVVKGEDQVLTAMAKTVGLPMAIAVKHILAGSIPQRGVQIPIQETLYNPLLNELADYGIEFRETIKSL